MNILGDWKITVVLQFSDSNEQIWMPVEEYLKQDDADESMLSSICRFADDGTFKMLVPIPEGVTQEELDAAVSSGEISLEGDFICAETYDWKEEDGKFFFDTKTEGEFLDEKLSSWVEVTVFDDGKIQLMMFKLAKAD